MMLEVPKTRVCTAESAADVFLSLLRAADEVEQDKEHIWAMGLDAAHRIKYVELVTMGLVDQAPCHPREVYRRAIVNGCSAIIIAHNHPSGQMEPSREDCELTSRLKVGGELLGIELLDHFIIATPGLWYSMAEHELL